MFCTARLCACEWAKWGSRGIHVHIGGYGNHPSNIFKEVYSTCNHCSVAPIELLLNPLERTWNAASLVCQCKRDFVSLNEGFFFYHLLHLYFFIILSSTVLHTFFRVSNSSRSRSIHGCNERVFHTQQSKRINVPEQIPGCLILVCTRPLILQLNNDMKSELWEASGVDQGE